MFSQVQAQTDSDFVNEALTLLAGSEENPVDRLNAPPLNTLLDGQEGFNNLLESLGLNQVETPIGPSTNCNLHEYSTQGQGDAHTVGSGVDGLTNDPDSWITFNSIIEADPFPELLVMPENVGIVILDDFELGIDIPEGAFEADIPEEPVPSESLPQELRNLSHGAMVLNHLNSLIAASTEFAPQGFDTFGTFPTYVWENNSFGHKINLMVVNMGQHTESAARALEEAIQVFKEQDIRKIVVNMSFSLLPCETVEAFKVNKERFKTFEDYLVALAIAILSQQPEWQDVFDELATLLGDQETITTEILQGFLGITDYELFRQIVIEALIKPYNFAAPNGGCPTIGVDSLLQAICNLLSNAVSNESDYLTFVAASGNYSLQYQTHPAALREVVGVSAFHEASGLAEFSNPGEIMEPGAFFRLTDPLDLHGYGGEGTVFYSGTSFAAPIVSLFTALEMSQAEPTCSSSTSDHRPGLVYTLEPNTPRHPDRHPQRPDYPALMNESINEARAATTPACPYP